MKNLKLEQTKSTPSVSGDAESGLIQVLGISIPEDAIKFYKNLINWSQRIVDLNKEITFIFKLHYVNSATLQIITKMLKNIKIETKNVYVVWYYELDDEDMMEVGENISIISKIEFEMIGVKECFKGF